MLLMVEIPTDGERFQLNVTLFLFDHVNLTKHFPTKQTILLKIK
jgi:hypothetical protein